jgi:hypothetical protein
MEKLRRSNRKLDGDAKFNEYEGFLTLTKYGEALADNLLKSCYLVPSKFENATLWYL